MKELLDEIAESVFELDKYYSETPGRPIKGPPATSNQLAELERHWQISLPPSYREALSAYNGMTSFYFDIPLLSTQEIIEDVNDSKTFEEFFPQLWRYLFAYGTESYDAFAFDPTRVSDDGEMEVVQIGEMGEQKRWQRFDLFLQDYLKKLKQDIENERADRAKLGN